VDCCSASLHHSTAQFTMAPKSPAKAKVEVLTDGDVSLVKPKAKAKSKGKTQAKGKGKSKAKGKGKAKSKSVPKVVENTIADTEVAADDEGPGLLPIDGSTEQPKAKAKSKMLASFRKKVLEMLNGKSVREGMAEAKQELAKVEAQCQESSALEEAHAAQAAATTKEFEETQIIMKEAIERETEAAQTYRRLSDQRAEESQREVDCRQQLLEEQRKLNILEVMALERRKMEELELKKKEASDTAEAARRKLAEHKQREKDALEATRKSLEGARHMGRAGKRTSVGGAKESPAKRQAQ